VVRAAAWSAFQSWGTQAISFAVLSVLARLLQPDMFGLVALASVFTAFVQVFIDQGYGDAIVQRAELERGHLDTAFWISLGAGTVLAGATVLGRDLVAAAFREPRLGPVVAWLSLSLVLAALSSTQKAILRRELLFKALALRSLASVAVGGVVGITMAVTGWGVWSLVGQYLAGGVAGVVVLWTASPWRPGFEVTRRHFDDIFSFGIHVLGVNVLNFLSRHLDDLLIGAFLGPTALGFYHVAYRMVQVLVKMLGSVLTQVAFPVFSAVQDRPERMAAAFLRAVRYTGAVAFPVFVGLGLVAREAVMLFFGSGWGTSVPVLRILAFIGIVQSVSLFNGAVIKAAGKPHWLLRLEGFNVFVNAVAFAIAVHWGIVAVAFAYTLRSYLVAPLRVWVVCMSIPVSFRDYGAALLPDLGCAATMAAGVGATLLLLPQEAGLLWRLTAMVATGIVTYGLAVRLIQPELAPSVASLLREGFRSERT
jgi:PST family polysaccharide transporter